MILGVLCIICFYQTRRITRIMYGASDDGPYAIAEFRYKGHSRMKYQSIRGTRDIFGKNAQVFAQLETIARSIFPSFGYEAIRTPIFEQVEVFTRSLGEKTDIVSKEMYDFVDKGDRHIALRPEGTASIVRAIIEHHLVPQCSEKKLFYIGPMFRYDRPQAGRYRQFYQIGAEAFGIQHPLIDAEMIELSTKVLHTIGITQFAVHINSVGCDVCRPKYTEALKTFAAAQDGLCPTCKERRECNVLRIFDCKVETCKSIFANAPRILDHICEQCAQNFAAVKTILDGKNIPYHVDPSLVRGLDYYTGTVFEVKTTQLGAQDALAAGGRYDHLVKQMGGSDVPAVGFALGVDRVVELLGDAAVLPQTKKIFFVTTGDAIQEIHRAQPIMDALRTKGFAVQHGYGTRSVKSQMRYANDWGADCVVFLEDNGMCSIKNMKNNGEQEQVHQDTAIERIVSLFVGI